MTTNADKAGFSNLVTEEGMRRHAQRMEVLYEASRVFAEHITNADRLANAIAQACSTLIGDYCSVTLIREGSDWIDLAAVYHPDQELEVDYRALASAVPARLGEGVMGTVLLKDEPLLMPEVDPEAIAARAPEQYRDVARRLNACSFVGVAMHARGRVIGGISMARSRPGAPYAQADMAYLQDLADRAALAIENSRLYAQLEQRVTEATAQLQLRNDELQHANASLQTEITEHERTEAALQRARDRAEEANGELEAFSYSVAHDLRAPLRTINRFSQVLIEESCDRLTDDGKAQLQRVTVAAQHMGRLIDDLLALSRVTRAELRRERVDLSQLTRNVFERLREGDPERRVELAIEDGLNVDADPRLLEIVLTNLVGNAWKFTGKREAARIELGARRETRPHVFFVRDNGAGFDVRYSARLFGVFQRLHAANEFEGTGIGLATVQRIIRRHGGRVWAEGQVDHGATFYFTLDGR